MKAHLRRQCLNKRDSLDGKIRDYYSLEICEKLCKHIQSGMNIMTYIPFKSEVNTSFINKKFKEMYYPVILEDNNMEARKGEIFEINKYGILEPRNGILIDPKDINIIIVPVAGFDDKKNRIGYGKGYYDRFLSKTNAYKIGLAFECQKINNVITDENDIPLDMIITEKNDYL